MGIISTSDNNNIRPEITKKSNKTEYIKYIYCWKLPTNKIVWKMWKSDYHQQRIHDRKFKWKFGHSKI
jgi:hypothetical protein